MCVVCVTVAGTVVVASQISPIELLSDFTTSQKTLTSFSSSSSVLSSKQKTEVKAPKKKPRKSAVRVKTPKPKIVVVPEVRTPFTTPFPEVFSRSELVKAAFDNVENYMRINSSSKSFELVLDKSASFQAVEYRTYVDRIYAALPFSPSYPKTIAVISNDGDFALKTIESFGIKRKYGPCSDCAGVGWSVSRSNLDEVIAHEIFHVWQKSAYLRTDDNNPDPNNPLNPPVWFQEGGATFFGAYFDGIFRQLRYGPMPWSTAWERLNKYNGWEFDRYGSYGIGMHATEYIVASVGFERYLQIYRNVGQGQTFPEAFENAVGISLANFYDKFHLVQRNIRI